MILVANSMETNDRDRDALSENRSTCILRYAVGRC